MPAALTDALLAEVLASYPLTAPRVVRSFEASTRNDNLLVLDERGRRFVLRRHRRNREIHRVEFQLRFEQFLVDAGFPAAAVVAARSGALLVVIEGEPWALFEYVEGDHLDFARRDQAVEAGRRLAQFHLLTEAFSGPEVTHELSHPVIDYWPQADLEIQRLYEMFGDPLAEDLAFMREWLAELHEALPLERLAALPSGWVHSDYHGRNLIFGGPEGDTLLALLDFDKIERGPNALDMARALWMFSRSERGSPDVRPDVAALFLEAYEQVRALSTAERVAVLALMGADVAPYSRYYPMLMRDGVDALTAVRADFANLRARRANAAQLASVIRGK